MAVPGLEVPYHVRFDECGPDGRLRASGHLRYAQDVAWLHAERAGFGRSWYEARGLTWLVRSIELVVHDPPAYGETVAVSTEVLGYRRVFARRRTEVNRADGALAAHAVIDWILLDAAGRPVSVPPDLVAAVERPSLRDIPLRITLPPQGGDVLVHPLHVRRHELDPMNHVNNAVYLDYLEEVLTRTPVGDALAASGRRYRLEYLLPAEPWERLEATAWPTKAGAAMRIRGREARELLRATFEPGPR